MHRTGFVLLVLLGVLGVLLGLVVVVGVWTVRPQVETRILDTTSAVLEGVDGMSGRLTRVDAVLGEADDALVQFRPEADERVRSTTREVLASTFPEAREQLQAIRDVARGIDALLAAADDLPFLDLGRVGGDRAEVLDGRLADGFDEALDDVTPVRDLVADARGLVGDWRRSVDALRGDVATLQDDLPCLLWLVVTVLTLLSLGCVIGGVCLIARGRRGAGRTA